MGSAQNPHAPSGVSTCGVVRQICAPQSGPNHFTPEILHRWKACARSRRSDGRTCSRSRSSTAVHTARLRDDVLGSTRFLDDARPAKPQTASRTSVARDTPFRTRAPSSHYGGIGRTHPSQHPRGRARSAPGSSRPQRTWRVEHLRGRTGRARGPHSLDRRRWNLRGHR